MIAHCTTAFAAGDLVGESILWRAEEEALYWIDICGCRIHRFEPASRRHETWPTPEFPTSIAMRKTGGFLVGLQHRVCLWKPGQDFETFAMPEPDRPENRLNEGRVAPDGSFWVATMQNNLEANGTPRPMTQNSGAIYRIDAEGQVTRLTENVFGILNTMAWTADGHFLFADTLANAIYRFRWDGVTNSLTDRQDFAVGATPGLPDGSCLDQTGRLWNCRFGGKAILCFASDGNLDQRIDLPLTSPTSCTFGGPDLSLLYVTSARLGMSMDELTANPSEGSLICADVGACGLAESRFG